MTWDEHIPDPDNPTQLRQIDVTVRRDGRLTLVECRYRKARQNVQWIEDLAGRRLSLGADSVIAVSSSGFTKGAVAKAKRLGVIARHLKNVTDLEVESWGQQVAITLVFYQYFDLMASLLFNQESIPKLDPDIVKSELRSHPAVESLFNAAAKQLDTVNLSADENPGRVVSFTLRLVLDGFLVCGEPIQEVVFSGKAGLLERGASTPIVRAYGEPNKDSEEREAMVETFPALGKTSVAHVGTRISTFIDLSQVEVPPFCQFRFVKQDVQQEVEHKAIEFHGLERLLVVKGEGMKLRLVAPGAKAGK